jgi:hypothetical protein
MIKTVLAPNAPWPQPEVKQEANLPKKRIRRSKVKLEIDYEFFKYTREQIQALKAAKRHSVRDVTTGRFTNGNRVSG